MTVHGTNKPALKHEWTGSWGPLSDGRSKLSRRARKIEQELTAEYQPRTDFQRRQVKAAARLYALADEVADGIGTRPKCTRRTLTALERSEGKLAQLRAIQNGQPSPATLADLLLRETNEG
jgi:hypothetical protein